MALEHSINFLTELFIDSLKNIKMKQKGKEKKCIK